MMDIPLDYQTHYKLDILHIQDYTPLIYCRNDAYSVGLSTKLQTEYMTWTRIYTMHEL